MRNSILHADDPARRNCSFHRLLVKLQKEQCAPGDSPALCKEVQKCFQSGISVEVCREGEKDAKSVESNKKRP